MKAPKYPDPMKTAAAQTGMNQSTAISQQLLNMVNENNPYGSLTYDQTGTRSFYDTAQGKMVDLPSFTATTKYSPEAQALFDQQMQFDKKFNDIALQQTDKIGGLLSTPFSYEPGKHEAWASGLYDKINSDSNTAAQNAMEQKLANQGLQPGTQAYDDAMRNLTYSQGRARDAFMLDSYGQGLGTAQLERNQPINEIVALINGQQLQNLGQPNPPQTGVNGVDYAGLVNQKYQADMQNYQSQMGGLFGLGSSLLGGLFALSDKRTKTNVKKVGKLDDGTKLYSYEYKPEFGGKRGLMHIGVMAQEAEKKHPEAVMTGADGYKRVNYGAIVEALQ